MEIKRIKATPVGAYYTSYKEGDKRIKGILKKGCGCGSKVKKG